MTIAQRGNALVEGRVGVLTLPFHVLDATLVAGQGLPERVQQLLDRLLALRQVSLRGGARLAEPGVGQGEKLLTGPGQRLFGQA